VLRGIPLRVAAAAAFSVGALLAPAGQARAEGESPAWRLPPEPVESSYRGRKVVIDFSRLTPQVTSITVQREPGGKERREFPSSHGVVITNGSVVWQYLPAERVVVRRPVRRGEGTDVLRPEQLRQAEGSYQVRSVPVEEAIAGRPSFLVEFAPRQPGTRPLRRVWVDVETGLVLRTEIYSSENRLSWLSAFEQIEYRSTARPDDFQPPPGVPEVPAAEEERCIAPRDAELASGIPVRFPRYLPAGFAQTCIHARRHHDYGEVQVLYSDGLSLLSLFESTHFREPGGGGRELETPVGVGQLPGRWYDLGLVTALAWGRPGAYFALLGELSRDELLKVGASIGAREELPGAERHPIQPKPAAPGR
jgi:outer membrane lipoprotein-sorting protein